MNHLVVEQFVRRPLDEVFAFCAEPMNAPVYMPMVREASMKPGPARGVGSVAVLRGAVELGPIKRGLETSWEMTECEPNRRFLLHSRSSEYQVDIEMRFEKAVGGVTVRSTCEWEIRHLGSLARFARRLFEEQVRKSLKNLKGHLEARPAGG